MSSPLRQRVHDLMPQAREDLAKLVAFRSVADPQQFPEQECLDCARYVIDAFAGAGLENLRLEQTADGQPAVYGEAAGPQGAPTVLLYCHHDVQPPVDEDAWRTPVWQLTEADGRWYGRGAADCKGNVVAHLTALRALEGLPVSLKLVSEGSEEQGTGGLEALVTQNPDLLRADAIVVADAGNFAVGVPTVTTTLRGVANVVVTVRTLHGAMHSGMFGGPAPDALSALIALLAGLKDERGNTTVRGLDNTQRWEGVEYPDDRFRADAGVLDGVDLVGDGSVADMLWARPSVTVLGIDCPPVLGSAAAVPDEARGRVSLRVPPGMSAQEGVERLSDHLRAAVPWNAQVEVEVQATGEPFRARTDGPAYAALGEAMRESFGAHMTRQGQGGSIPLCKVLADTFPEAEIMLIGVEEPRCLIHAPNESVDPSEIQAMALTEAIFLERYATMRS